MVDNKCRAYPRAGENIFRRMRAAIVADMDADGFVEVVTGTQQEKILIIDK